jgi:hypothetical protein
VPVEGGEETLVLEQVAFWDTFAMGNQGIYFFPRLDISGGSHLDFFDFATGKIKTIANVEKPWNYGLAVSPDGRYILYSRIDQQDSDVMLVENFR